MLNKYPQWFIPILSEMVAPRYLARKKRWLHQEKPGQKMAKNTSLAAVHANGMEFNSRFLSPSLLEAMMIGLIFPDVALVP